MVFLNVGFLLFVYKIPHATIANGLSLLSFFSASFRFVCRSVGRSFDRLFVRVSVLESQVHAIKLNTELFECRYVVVLYLTNPLCHRLSFACVWSFISFRFFFAHLFSSSVSDDSTCFSFISFTWIQLQFFALSFGDYMLGCFISSFFFVCQSPRYLQFDMFNVCIRFINGFFATMFSLLLFFALWWTFFFVGLVGFVVAIPLYRGNKIVILSSFLWYSLSFVVVFAFVLFCSKAKAR